MDEPKKQPDRIFLHEGLAIKIIMDCSTVEAYNFKKRLGFNLHGNINTKQQTITESIKDSFERENMQSEHYVSGYRIDLHFHDYRLAIEVGEFGHCDRHSDYEEIEKRG